MATTYDWKIVTCEHEVATGGITVAHWECIAVDGDYTARVYGSCGFTPDASAPDFVAYDSLTEDFVLHWVWHQIDKDETEAALAAKIDADKNPVSASGTPW
jgi:hypothetical protein